MARAVHIQVKRAYDPVSEEDGQRFLVDRLWPRGIKKEDLVLTAWPKEISPSTELRNWYSHEPEKWEEFRRRYFRELDKQSEAWKTLVAAARKGPITLVYSSKVEDINNAVALRDYLKEKLAHS
jgi:uncharacterized protein YeaO (DUF488 family)